MENKRSIEKILEENRVLEEKIKATRGYRTCFGILGITSFLIGWFFVIIGIYDPSIRFIFIVFYALGALMILLVTILNKKTGLAEMKKKYNKNKSILKKERELQKYNAKPSIPVNITNDYTEELKKLKDLLDAGVITQDEFDAKKKQLLG